MSDTAKAAGAKKSAGRPAATEAASKQSSEPKAKVVDRIQTVVEWHRSVYQGRTCEARRVNVLVVPERDEPRQTWFKEAGLCGTVVPAVEIEVRLPGTATKGTVLVYDADGSGTAKFIEPAPGTELGSPSLDHQELRGYVTGVR